MATCRDRHVALCSVLFWPCVLGSLCRWPVPLPGGYIVTGCNTIDPLLPTEVSTCTVACDEAFWHFGTGALRCDSVTGLLVLEGCQSPTCPVQCGAYTAVGSVSGANLVALAVDLPQDRLLAVDQQRHVLLALAGAGASFVSQVLWGTLGSTGDADGDALSSARLSSPSSLAVAVQERYVLVADTGNGKIRALSMLTNLVFTLATGFAEPKALVLASSELLVADASSGDISRLPVDLTNLEAQSVVSAATLQQVPGSVGLSRPSWLGYRESIGELFVSEAAGALGVYRMTLSGARTSLVATAGSWPSSSLLPQPVALGAVTAPGAVVVDETVGVANVLLVDSTEKRIFAIELMKSGRSCAELSWDSDTHGSPKVCGRSAGDPSILTTRCDYTYAPGICCSGSLTFPEAQSFCSLQGARLCTQEELFDNEASDAPLYQDCITGSSWVYDGPYDRANIWSSSPCTVPSTGLPGFMTRSGTRRWGTWAPDSCRAETQRAFVKCCADRDLMMPMAGFQPPAAVSSATHGLFHSFTGSDIAVAMDSGRRLLFLADGAEVAMLSFAAARFVAAGQLGYEDVIGSPAGIAWSEEDQLLLADHENHVLRRVDVLLSGSNNIIAGQLGVAGDAGDGGLAVASSFHRPSGIAMDALNRHAYVATGQHRLRRVELINNGGVTTVINTAGVKGAWGDRGFGPDAQLSDPQNVLVEQDRIYVADRNNQRVRMLDLSTGRVDSVAGPLLIISAGTGYQAQYAVFPDPNMTSAALPRDLVTTSPVGVAVAPDGSYLILSDEHSQSLLHVDRSVVPRRVRVIQGTHDVIADPKDLLLAENATLFVSDHASHSIFALEFVCDADEVHYTGGCRALHLRRLVGLGSPTPGDGDVARRQPTTVTSTTWTISTSTITLTTSELPCWNHILGGRGEDCDSTCARFQGTCDPNVRSNFDFDAFQQSVFQEERVNCERDARSWWDDAMPSYETNPDSRNFGWCLGTWNMPDQIPCNAVFLEYGQPSTTMRRWCKCRREEMCYMTTTTTVPPAFVPTTTFTRTWTGDSTTMTRVTTTSSSTSLVTHSTLGPTTSPSPYVQLCPQGYNPLASPLPLTSPSSQNSAVDCGVQCEVTTGCVAFVFDATVGFCATHPAPAGASFPVSTDPGREHYTSCERDPSMPDVLLDLLLVDWMPSNTPLNFPGAMALDYGRQLLYFSDTGNHKIKVFDMTRNEVMTAAGLGASLTKFSGDGQPARQATMASPKGLALDEENSHLYLTDSENHVIRRLKLGSNRLTGIIETVAGTSVGGKGQDALDPSLTRFNYPSGLALEKLSNGVKLYVSDTANQQVVVVDLASAPNVVRKIAGKLDFGLVPTEVGDKGPALAAQVVRPQALVFSNDTQEIFFAEPQQERLRQMDLTTDIIDTALQTYAVNFSIGEGLAGLSPLDYDAALGFPFGAAVVDQMLYTASYGTGEVRRTNLSSGITTAFAGRRNLGYYPIISSGDGAAAELAILAGPVAVVAHKTRQVLYIAESDGGRVRQVDLTTGIITTLNASIPEQSRSLYGMALDPLRDVLFVSSPSERVVYGFRLDTAPCLAPTAVTNGASLACAEGNEIHGERCSAQCASGYSPSIAALYCASGILTPPSFTCQAAHCSAPWGIAHAHWPSCEEGDRIASGGSCTSQCHSGVADANLTCDRGVLSPSTFTCVLPTTLTVTVTGGSGSGGSSVTAAPAGSVVGGGTLSVVDILELEDTIFGPTVVFNPETAPRSNVALNGSFSFEAVTAGLTFAEVSLLCGSDVLRQPLKDALVEVLALLPEDLEILALVPEAPGSRLRRLAVTALTHRFNMVLTLPTPPPWAELRFGALRLQTQSAQQEWFNALQKVHFLDAMVEISANRDRPCSLPRFAINAPQIPCEEGQVTTASHGVCTAKCLSPLHPSEDTLQCFAGIWSPSSFSCSEEASSASSDAACPVPTGIADAAANPCHGLQANTVSPGSYCAPQCEIGAPTESVLACIDGQLQPGTFSCLSQECSAPDVAHAASTSCLEGETVPSGRQCTAACQPGFRPTANLSCWGGQLVPSRFLCLNFTDLGAAVDDFWGSGGGDPSRPWASTTQGVPANPATAQGGATSASFWNFVNDRTFHLVLAITGAVVALLLFCLLLRCCFRRYRRRKASAKKEEVAWESAAEEIARQNSVFESERSSPKRKTSRASSKASSEGGSKREVAEAAFKEGSISRLEGPEEVKEILRVMAGEAEESVEKMPSVPDQDLTADLDEEFPLSSRESNGSDSGSGPEFELLRLAIEAAKDLERPEAVVPPPAAMPVRKPAKDAVFEAMDRELGEAVTSAAAAPALQSRSRSLIAQKPRRPSQTRL